MRSYLYGFAVFQLAAAACSKGSPASPSATAAAAAAPVPLVPTNGAQLPNSAQPVTLVVQNASGTQPGNATYTFEVATDSAFANRVQTRTGVATGNGGQSSVTLSTLVAGSEYYWHAQVIAGGAVGEFSVVSKFTIGTLISIDAPSAIAPANGASVTTQPTLTVTDATRTGLTGAMAYRFDISTSPTFATVTITGSATESAGQTSFTPAAALGANTTYYWRATAIDQTNSVVSPASAVLSFTTMSAVTTAGALAGQEGLTLWPGIQPSGTPGHAVLGNGWQVQTIPDFTGVQFVNPVLDALRVFDLLDRGMDPQSALNWLNSHGYPNTGAFYASVNVIGFPQEYMAFINGQWDMVIKVGA
jgi:hypothetical protein